MKKTKQKKHLDLSTDSSTNWQTMSDAVISLLLIVLLVNMILILYIVQIPDEKLVDDEWGHEDHYDDRVHYISPSPSPTITPTHLYDYDWHDGGGGGGGDTPAPSASPSPEPTATPEYVPAIYPEGEGPEKAAVYVMVIDAETGRAIKEQGVEFDLLNHRDAVQTLRTYYPLTTAYRLFETSAMGVFYLPEKISMGTFRLRELTEPSGYDASEPVEFFVDTAYDWPAPLTVKVPLYPSRNVIRVQMNDADTGVAVGQGAYDVVAAEAIVTADGTLRYAEGDVVAQIALDEEGFGESPELYLGSYTLRQTVVPPYYAADREPLTVQVEKKRGDEKPAAHRLTCRKTAISIQVLDELYDNLGISGAEFLLTADAGTQPMRTVYTDSAGRMELSDLAKNARYTLRQTASPGDYLPAGEPFSFTVDVLGLINGEPRVQETMYNRMIRVSVSVRDSLLKADVADNNIALYNEQGELLQLWNSTGVARQLTNLGPGAYSIVINGSQTETLTVRDEKEVQTFSFLIWSAASIGLIIGGAALALAAVIVSIVLIIRKIKKNKATAQPQSGGDEQ